VGAERRRNLGQRGESAVERWYRDAGFVILARNWRCAEGEIDIIARSPGGAAVICEVKTRSSATFGSPFEAVTNRKQLRLRRLATRWLAMSAASGGFREIRFDVAAVTAGPGGTLEVEVLEGAF
jgi:putative endonuclease